MIPNHSTFDLDKVSTTIGADGGRRFSYADDEGNPARISPWHDVPFAAGVDVRGVELLSFVCEIPRGTRAKMEIHKTEPYNPVLQDVHNNGSLRELVYSPAIVNYGAIAQTWEDPKEPDQDTKVGGDNDPIDVLQLNAGSCRCGQIQRVRVLGAFALVDDGKTDWKLLVVDANAADCPTWRDIGDIPNERISDIREWYRNYKTAEGKAQNTYGLNERAVDAAHALRVAKDSHRFWAAGRERTAKLLEHHSRAPCARPT